MSTSIQYQESVTIRLDYAQLIKFDKGQIDKGMLLAMMGEAATDDED